VFYLEMEWMPISRHLSTPYCWLVREGKGRSSDVPPVVRSILSNIDQRGVPDLHDQAFDKRWNDEF